MAWVWGYRHETHHTNNLTGLGCRERDILVPLWLEALLDHTAPEHGPAAVLHHHIGVTQPWGVKV